jgi:hypothetical protein
VKVVVELVAVDRERNLEVESQEALIQEVA